MFVATGAWALMDGWYRLFYGTRPFDRLMLGMDAAILVVSIAGIVIGWLAWKRYGLRKRQKALAVFLSRGRDLLANPPYGSADTPAWTDAVESFTRDVTAYLQKKSPRAVGSFLETFDMPMATNAGVLMEVRVDYAVLNHRLRNLMRIMENAEAYF